MLLFSKWTVFAHVTMLTNINIEECGKHYYNILADMLIDRMLSDLNFVLYIIFIIVFDRFVINQNIIY